MQSHAQNVHRVHIAHLALRQPQVRASISATLPSRLLSFRSIEIPSWLHPQREHFPHHACLHLFALQAHVIGGPLGRRAIAAELLSLSQGDACRGHRDKGTKECREGRDRVHVETRGAAGSNATCLRSACRSSPTPELDMLPLGEKQSTRVSAHPL